MLDWWFLDISELFQHFLVTPLALLPLKAPSSFPMHLGDPLILIFATVFEGVDFALPLLQSCTYPLINLETSLIHFLLAFPYGSKERVSDVNFS